MENEQTIRPLTREEQLEWLIPFLEEQLQQIQYQLILAQEEMKEINKDNKVLIKSLGGIKYE